MLVRIVNASDSAIVVIFGESITREFHEQVVRLFRALRARRDPRIRNIHPAYASVLVDFDPLLMNASELTSLLDELADGTDETSPQPASRLVEIPVCYDAEFAPDLTDVAAHCHLTEDEVIRAHSSATYFASFLGFSPGFAYLGGLPESLTVPRLSSPRKLVPAGSVGIAGTQTGVYPQATPGGWRLIGRTPLRMFDPQAQAPSRLQLGDTVRFVPMTRARFDELSTASEQRP